MTVEVNDLKSLCREHLSGYKRPTAIHVLDVLPKNAVGKLDKRSLRDLLPPAPAR